MDTESKQEASPTPRVSGATPTEEKTSVDGVSCLRNTPFMNRTVRECDPKFSLSFMHKNAERTERVVFNED